MEKLYDRADIYDLLESEARSEIVRNDWRNLLAGREIRTLLDVSIGSGNMTLPLQELGIEVSGSDLNAAMLRRCGEKAQARHRPMELKCCDFRDLSVWNGRSFDCVASTGNSLAYVSNDGVRKALEEMDAHVRPGGYLCFDSRNWEKIQRKRQRFYLYNPFFRDGTRINLVQVWDHNADGTITFNLLYTFEQGQPNRSEGALRGALPSLPAGAGREEAAGNERATARWRCRPCPAAIPRRISTKWTGTG